MQTSGSTPLPRRFESLDIWRGLACLGVVIFHAFMPSPEALSQSGLWPGFGRLVHGWTCRMWVGVPIFFVISGYCIAAAVDSHRARKRPLHEFFTRRLRRIYVPYLAALALTAGVVWACDLASAQHRLSALDMPHPTQLSLANWLGNLTLTETLRSGLMREKMPQLQLWTAWSLCHEVQFYAISGLCLLLAARYFFPLCAAITVVTAVLVTCGARLGLEPTSGCVLRGTWLMFAMGLAVYWQLARNTRVARWATLAFFSVALVWTLSRWRLLVTPESNTTQQICYAAITAILLVVLHPFDRSLANHSLAKPLAALGKISFSVYLIHFPVVRFFDFQRAVWLGQGLAAALLVLVVSTLASVLAGCAFYLLIERRALGAAAEKRSTDAVIPRPHFPRSLEPAFVTGSLERSPQLPPAERLQSAASK